MCRRDHPATCGRHPEVERRVRMASQRTVDGNQAVAEQAVVQATRAPGLRRRDKEHRQAGRPAGKGVGKRSS